MADESVMPVHWRAVAAGDIVRINGQKVKVVDAGPVEVIGLWGYRRITVTIEARISKGDFIQRWSRDQ